MPQGFPIEFVKPSAESIACFVFLSLAFLVLCLIVLRWTQSAASKLVALGILVGVLSVGFGALLGTPAVVSLTAGLMKIAVILTLGGVAYSIASLAGTTSRSIDGRSTEGQP